MFRPAGASFDINASNKPESGSGSAVGLRLGMGMGQGWCAPGWDDSDPGMGYIEYWVD